MRATNEHFGYFVVYYFPHYIKNEFAPFHYDMMMDLHDLVNLDIRELAWFQFRESAKTSFSKMFICYLICNRRAEYINVDCFDKDNAERILYDVVWELQTNKRLIDDFGQLYNTDRTAKLAEQKRISDFTTNPVKDKDGNILHIGVRCEAHSTQEPIRGRLHNAKRPDFVLLDDFETIKTIKSKVYTKNIADHIAEMKGGLDAQNRKVLYLGNYISEFANVQSIIDRQDHDPELRVRIVPIIKDGVPTWPQKYCMTDEEAKVSGLVSIEAKRRSMWTPEEGDTTFQAEMLCNPIDDRLSEFKREYFQQIKFDRILEQQTSVYVTIDTPSQRENSKMDKADFCGICINWVNKENKWHFKAWREKLGPTQIIEKMLSIHLWLISVGTPASKFGWEDTAYTRGLEIALRTLQRERNVFLPTLIWLKTQGRAKKDRIRSGLLHRYETRSIFHVENECLDLENELLRFPNSQNDDCSDASAYQSDIARPFSKDERAKVVENIKIRSAYEEDDDENDTPDSRFQRIGI
ncbi:MAG TPA: hypothetical protein PK698_06415 [Bacilli bacterium]|nr:hypothetical protein [Bacilli bacterium]